jgi:hypothetical protein
MYSTGVSEATAQGMVAANKTLCKALLFPLDLLTRIFIL